MTNEMITMYDGLIYSIILKYYSGYSSQEDLLQVGRRGLLVAYSKYDPSYGVKFETYAYDFIRGEMSQYIQQDKAAKFSRSVVQLKNKIEWATNLLTQELMRSPNVTELSLFLKVSESEIIEAMQTIYQMQSIQTPIGQGDKEITLEDYISAPQMDIDTLIALKDAIQTLPSDEQELLLRRYYGETQAEIAERLGMNQVQVSRKVKKIGEKIMQKVA